MSYTNQTKNTTTFTTQDYGSGDYLLGADGDYVLTAASKKIVLSNFVLETYANQALNTASYTNQSKS